MEKERVLSRKREVVGSRAFNLEYEPQVLDERLRVDIISYLGEYRFKLQKYNYDLEFSGKRLRDPRTNTSLLLTAKRGIEDKRLRKEPTHREEAEEIGIGRLDEQISIAHDGDMIFWGSPPGTKEEGFGDYGFIFAGKISKKTNNAHKVSMTAIRVEHPTIEQYNRAMTLLTAKPYEYNDADSFLKDPVVVRPVDDAFIDRVIGVSFNQKIEKDKGNPVFDQAIKRMSPIIDDFVRFVKLGTRSEKIKAFNAIENYALELKRKLEGKGGEKIVYMSDCDKCYGLEDVVKTYGYREPPKALGSCGSSANIKSNNTLNKFDILKNALDDQEWFTCPKCKWKADGPIGNGPCGGCGLTLSQWMNEAKQNGDKVCA